MRNIGIIAALVMISLTACSKKPSEQPFVPDPVIPSTGTLPAGHPAINSQENPMAAIPGTFQSQKGTVVSVINIPEFTYLEVSQDSQTRWIVAASVVEVKKGDTIEFDSGTTIRNFTSKTLKRTFPSISFVNHVNIVKN
ncbi:MAG: hypothetical protein LJE57_01950 [Gallionella sp.]|nr:hypothetical protein [Gallionella sp.]